MFGKLGNPDKAELGRCRGTGEYKNSFHTGTERNSLKWKGDKISPTNKIDSMENTFAIGGKCCAKKLFQS